MRASFVVLLAAIAILISGCSGGFGNGHSGRGAYFDAIESGFTCGTATPESFTPDPTRSIADAQHEVDAFTRLTPPDELASVHRELALAEQAMLDFVRQTGGAVTPLPQSAGFVDKERALVTAEAKWQDAFASHYGAVLFRMEGISMEPAFHNGDLIAFTPYSGETLSRWQTISFKFPLDETRTFAKRVVGLPGETVEISGGAIKINGSQVEDDTFALASANYSWGPRTVPSDSYFVLGDNRRNSYDSHAWAGVGCPTTQTCAFVPKNLIIGELPATGVKPLSQWWCPPTEADTATP